MNYITFFIQPAGVTGIAVNIKSRKANIIIKQHMPIIDANNSDIVALELKTLTQQFLAVIGHKQKSKVIYRIIVADGKLMQSHLALPNIGLNKYEIERYIEGSLYKTFNTKQLLSYDYRLKTDNTKSLQLIIYAYQQILIKRYIELYEHTKLRFIGVTSSMITHDAISELDITEFDKIALLPTIAGINFLPWRDRKRKYNRVYFLVVIMVFFVLYGIAIWLWREHAYSSLDEQLRQNQLIHNELQQKTQQLALLINAHNTLLKLQANLAEQIASKEQFILLRSYLGLVSLTIPDGIWLSSLSYQKETLELKGESFLYADILIFLNLLEQHDKTQHYRIVSVKMQQHLLQFIIDAKPANLVQEYDD
ncbi:PilN domain-containing protein [Orbus sturtevantii]|uniref:PilN domain-containing protein n=1 Tax=Orbus sturtevantii TaxID=3074109 RepID=UPI00370D3D77